MLKISKYFSLAVTVFSLALFCQSATAASKKVEQINEKCGPYAVSITPSGTISSISINGEKILKRGFFFINLESGRDSQGQAKKQGGETEVKEVDGKKILTSHGSLKENGNNLEYAQQITIDPEDSISVKLKIKYLLNEPRHLQYELMLTNPKLIYGKSATAINTAGTKQTNTIPSENLKPCELIGEYFFKHKSTLSSFAVSTNKGILKFEFIDGRGRLFSGKNGSLNWIVTPLNKPTPGSIISLHYKISGLTGESGNI